jgi:hypothetical protein
MNLEYIKTFWVAKDVKDMDENKTKKGRFSVSNEEYLKIALEKLLSMKVKISLVANRENKSIGYRTVFEVEQDDFEQYLRLGEKIKYKGKTTIERVWGVKPGVLKPRKAKDDKEKDVDK